MNDLICELVKEDDPFLKEVPEDFDFDSPQVDAEKLAKLESLQAHSEAISVRKKNYFME